VAESFEKLFARLAAEGRIAPDMDVPTVAKVFSVLGDGLFMRRALDPDFEPDVVIPAVMKLVEKLLGPQPDNGEPRGEREEQATEPRR
jgi:hypothetical protein